MSLRNPWSTYPFTPIQYQLMGTSAVVSQTCTNIQITMSSLATSVLVLFPLTTTISQMNNNTRLRIYVKNPCPITGSQLQMSHPSSLTVLYNGSQAIVTQSTTSITFSSVCTTNLPGTPSSYTFNGFYVTNPPSTRAYSIVFQTNYNTGGITYGI